MMVGKEILFRQVEEAIGRSLSEREKEATLIKVIPGINMGKKHSFGWVHVKVEEGGIDISVDKNNGEERFAFVLTEGEIPGGITVIDVNTNKKYKCFWVRQLGRNV